jgi:hypothetical protein
MFTDTLTYKPKINRKIFDKIQHNVMLVSKGGNTMNYNIAVISGEFISRK